MQAVAGRPLLPHVYVLPHGAIPTAEHRAATVRTPTSSWPEAMKPPRSLFSTCHGANKMSAKHKLSASVFITAFPPLPMLSLAGDSWLQHYGCPNSGSICKLRQFCFGHKMMLNFKRWKMWTNVLPPYWNLKVAKTLTAPYEDGAFDGECGTSSTSASYNLLSCQTPTHKSELTDHIFTVLAAS